MTWPIGQTVEARVQEPSGRTDMCRVPSARYDVALGTRSDPAGVAVLARVGAADQRVARDEDRLAAAEAVRSRSRARSCSRGAGGRARGPRAPPRGARAPVDPEAGRSSAACGSRPSSTSAETSCMCACAWMKPPMTPNGPSSSAVAEEHPRDDRVVRPPAGLHARRRPRSTRRGSAGRRRSRARRRPSRSLVQALDERDGHAVLVDRAEVDRAARGLGARPRRPARRASRYAGVISSETSAPSRTRASESSSASCDAADLPGEPGRRALEQPERLERARRPASAAAARTTSTPL